MKTAHLAFKLTETTYETRHIIHNYKLIEHHVGTKTQNTSETHTHPRMIQQSQTTNTTLI